MGIEIDWGALATVVVALIMAIPGILAFRRSEKAEEAAIEKERTLIAKEYRDMLEAEIAARKELRQRVDCLEKELDRWKKGVAILIEQMNKEGIKPRWTPDGQRIRR